MECSGIGKRLGRRSPGYWESGWEPEVWSCTRVQGGARTEDGCNRSEHGLAESIRMSLRLGCRCRNHQVSKPVVENNQTSSNQVDS
jgi:hypothetical protein